MMYLYIENDYIYFFGQEMIIFFIFLVNNDYIFLKMIVFFFCQKKKWLCLTIKCQFSSTQGTKKLTHKKAHEPKRPKSP